VRKAIEAYKVEVDEGSGGQAPGPLQLTYGLLAGSQYIYQSFGMIELNNQQDTPTGEAYWQTLARIAVS
jgi:hypothetical protein